MRIAFAVLLILHGAIHLLGFVKGFGLADVGALRLAVSRTAGISWLLAALGFLAAAGLFIFAPARWWIVGAPTLVLSQVLVIRAWPDARFGTVPNVIVSVPLILAILQASPRGFRSVYGRESASLLAQIQGASTLITETDLAPLPPLLANYLSPVGVVGKPHVQALRASFHGRFRQGPDAPWMTFTSEQHNFVAPSVRLFFMKASRNGIPMEALHRFSGREARMQVRVASLIDVVDARGPQMNQGESVTIFNDLCVLAPAALVDLPIRWEPLDARSVRGTFTRGDQTVSAVLSFDPQGDLVDFLSEDRFMSADGKSFQKPPWSTPLHDYRAVGGVRLPTRDEAVWKLPGGDFVYGEFLLDEIGYFPPADRTAEVDLTVIE